MFGSFAACCDVLHRPPFGFEIIGYQRPMTSPPHCFSAHVDGGLPGGQRLQLFNRFRELIRFHIVGITPERTVSPAAVPGVFLCLSPAAKAFYMNILD